MDTWAGDLGLTAAQTVVAATAATARAAYRLASWLSRLDPVLTGVSARRREAVTGPLAPLLVPVTGLWLIAVSGRARYATTTAAAGGLVLAVTVLFLAADAPVRAGSVTG